MYIKVGILNVKRCKISHPLGWLSFYYPKEKNKDGCMIYKCSAKTTITEE
jgi:hypothetical protein